MAWQLLLVRSVPLVLVGSANELSQGYLPAPSTRRLPTLARKRQEYADAVRLAFSRGVAGLDGPIWHQISIDVPRTNSSVRLWQGEGTQRVCAIGPGRQRSEADSRRARSLSNGSSTFGLFGIRPRATCRASTTWSLHSSKCSSRATSVSRVHSASEPS